MEKLKIKKTFTVENEKPKEWFQLFGEEATKWFGYNCHWIAWKHSRTAIDRAWHLAQKNNDHNLRHFLANVAKS